VDDVQFEERFRALFGDGFPRLHRYLYRLTGDPALASDLAQEAFVRLYERGSMPDRVAAWLAAVAHNLSRNEWRRAGRQRRLLEREAGMVPDQSTPAADAAMLSGERVRQVREALNRLSLRDRQMLLLRHEGYSYREIADAMELTPTSVGAMLVRAGEAFKAAYEEVDHASG
jgi:RNA polymerase sigma factor (sigma-70 family)